LGAPGVEGAGWRVDRDANAFGFANEAVLASVVEVQDDSHDTRSVLGDDDVGDPAARDPVILRRLALVARAAEIEHDSVRSREDEVRYIDCARNRDDDVSAARRRDHRHGGDRSGD
jgi:hypothetical protein